MTIKDHRLQTYRTSTHRDVEDWRKERADTRQGPWAIHCLDHAQRTFVPSYSKAKGWAVLPAACPTCKAFDQRCVYCPSDLAQWHTNPQTGYTTSAGHIAGNAVCCHHKYGNNPEGIDYLEVRDVVLDKAVIEIFLGGPFTGTKVFIIKYQTGDQKFWLQLHRPPEYMTGESATRYHRALGFALSAVSILNESLNPRTDSRFGSPGFETWEELAERQAEEQRGILTSHSAIQ